MSDTRPYYLRLVHKPVDWVIAEEARRIQIPEIDYLHLFVHRTPRGGGDGYRISEATTGWGECASIFTTPEEAIAELRARLAACGSCRQYREEVLKRVLEAREAYGVSPWARPEDLEIPEAKPASPPPPPVRRHGGVAP